ncbi:MAG: hypothetical protein ACFUZC_12190 [Chthoniobacteraceae bacterium]
MKIAPRHLPQNGRGMALVITLASLVLLTVLVLAFFSKAQCNRQISYSSTSLLNSKFITRSAMDIITGELRAEIADSTRSTLSGSNGVWLYQPKSAAYLLPAQLGVSGASGPLVKVSADSTSIRPNGTIQGSSVSISTPGLNGQSISAARWFTSSVSSPMLGKQSTLPTWLFLTRGNGVITPGSLADARNTANNDYVIGRFAYTVYDIGQLLDANLAGYPSTAAADAAQKSSCAYADLTALGLTSANISSLISWRNAVTATDAQTFFEWASGIAPTSGTSSPSALNAARSGHLSIANGDNTICSRRDLLNNPNLASAAGSLTHFSRTTNAPSYAPATVTGTNPNFASLRFQGPATVTHYQDDGSVQTYSVQAGDFMLQRRFSLARIAWLTHTGPLAGISDDAIKACFGLKWDSSMNGWIYVGDSASAQPTIKTLAQVAAANREPNFFELLQAGILQGSLGQSSGSAFDNGGMSMGKLNGVSTNKAYQIIRIGANIIDQYDSDSYPTAISFNGYQFYGIEDIPYFNKIVFKNYAPNIVGGHYAPPYHVYFIYELWNPHQPISSDTTGRPTRFRIRVGSNATYQLVGVKSFSPTVTTTLMASPELLSTADGTLMEFDVDSTNSDPKFSYREPRLIRTGDSAKLWPELADPTLGACNALRLKDVTSLPNGDTTIIGMVYTLSSGIFVLEYNDGSVWRPYTTFTGLEESSMTGLGGAGSYSAALGLSGNTGVKGVPFTCKSDPRTFRFDAVDCYALNQDAGDISLHSSTNAYLSNNHIQPDFIPKNTVTYMSMLAGNTTTAKDPNNNTLYYTDGDSVVRPADAAYGDNPYELGNSAPRPLVLNRPFRNVGDLGYAFRDLPWKTLDLFSDKSADGALLDLFSVSDEPARTAGRVSLNSSQPAVAQSLFSEAQYITNASDLASLFVAFSGSNTFSNIALLPNFLATSPASLSTIKTQREAPVRALASSSQTRTWNLLIDVVAQTGRYTARSNSLNDFLVEGETRYWLSVAIDRYTGKIIDQQLENANEH